MITYACFGKRFGNFMSLPRFARSLNSGYKREIKDCPKLPSATSFIRKPLGKIRGEGNGRDTV